MKKHVLLFISLIVFAVPGFCYSEEGAADTDKDDKKEAVTTMGEVVVTATRDKEEVRKVPSNVTVITAEEIEKVGATTIVEVLEKLESIHFKTWSGNPSQAYIDMRGFGGDNPFGKTLVQLDGRRLNRPDMASVNWLQVPINNIERIEIIRGSSSVLYGDAAVAGVINIITKRGEGKPVLGASVMAGSYGLQDGRASVTGSVVGLSYALTAEDQESTGYRERSEFSSTGGGINLGYDVTDYLLLSGGYSYNKTYFQMPGSLTKEEMALDRKQFQPARGFWAAHPDDYQENEYHNANANVEAILGDFGRIQVGVMGGKKILTSHVESNFNPNKYNVGDLDTFAVTPKYIWETDVFKHHENKLMFGFDYYQDTMDIDKFNQRIRNTESKTHVVDLERKSYGYYVRDDFSLFKRLIVSGGYRWEEATIEGKQITLATNTTDFDDEKKHKSRAYEGGLTLLIGDKSKVYGKYSTVYRYPFMDEQASYWGFGTDTFLKDLEKEKGESIEAGAEFYPVENLKISGALYRINMKDEIIWNNTTNRNENLDKTRHQGAEVSVLFRQKGIFDVYGNYTYHDAEFREGENTGKTVPLVPANMANLGAELYLPYSFGIRFDMRYVDDCFLGVDNDNSSEELEGYTEYDLFLVFKPQRGKLKVRAFFGVENFTNKEYSTMGFEGNPNVYYPSPGRTFKGGISFVF